MTGMTGSQFLESMGDAAEIAGNAAFVGGAAGLGARGALGATKWGASKLAPRALPYLEGMPGVGPAALRALGRAPGAVPATGGSEYLWRKYMQPGAEGPSPEQSAAIAAGAELGMQALSPLAHPAGNLAMKVLQKIPGAERALDWIYSRIPMIGSGLRGQRAGADEAIEVLEAARLARRGEGGHITLAQTLDSRLIQEFEGASEAAFGGGPLLRARARGEATIRNELWQVSDELLRRSPKDALVVLESVLSGSGQLHRTYVRAAYRQVDESLENVAARTGGNPWWNDPTSGIPPGRIRVDLTEVFAEAEKWGVLNPAARKLEAGPSLIYDAMQKMGTHPNFEDAHILQSAIGSSGKTLERIMPGKSEAFAKRIVHMINAAMDEAADKIPSKMAPVWETASARSGAAGIAEIPTRSTTVRDVYDYAKAVSKQGKELFNEGMIGPLMRAPSPEQFANAVVKGVRAPETLRVTKQIIFDARYRTVIESMGKRHGIEGFSPDDLWDGVRGRWLQDQLRRSTGDSIEGTISGKSLHDKFVKNDVTREMFPELFNAEEQGRIIDMARGMGAIQRGATGSAGANVMRLAQFGAATTLFIPGAQEYTGGTLPWAIILGPVAIARIFKSRALVRTLNRGLDGKVAATGGGRFMVQFMRQLVEEAIPFAGELSDGTTYQHDPNRRRASAATRTSIPSP